VWSYLHPDHGLQRDRLGIVRRPQASDERSEALALVQAQTWGKSARLGNNGALISPAPGNRGRDLNIFLVQAGFAPDTITESTQNLEEVFLRLTGNGHGGVQ